jgi:hypothetical protein
VTVRRPAPLDFGARFRTPEWSSTGFCTASPRDGILVVGDQLIETAWQLASRQDAETRRILDETVVLLAHANPDGQELVSNWYMRQPVPAKRSYGGLPRLYQKYIGHDNNRDFFLGAMKESANLNRQLYVEWIPQILYNHHQSSPTGTIVAGPPYRDPFNHVYDPALVTTLDGVGAAMAHRLHHLDRHQLVEPAPEPARKVAVVLEQDGDAVAEAGVAKSNARTNDRDVSRRGIALPRTIRTATPDGRARSRSNASRFGCEG